MGVTTVSGNGFPHKDITHKPKRKQSEIENENNSNSAGSEAVNVTLSSVPQSVTLESAITYFKDNASGANKQLFNRTASWLEDLRERLAEEKKAKVATARADTPVDTNTMQSAT